VVKLDQRCEFIPVDYPSAHEAKESFKKLLRVAAPAAIADSSSSTHLKNLDESGWLQQIKSILQISNAIVDLVDLQNSSVAVCLEYGWDATIQIVSLAELMLDPFYRTIEGFRTLIEKEWSSFGHRFSHRCNHTLLSSSSGFAPIFLQFLDAVHQIHQQFPSEFEFNDFYLRFLAYHSTATYFRTFLLDCEADRIESGLSLQSDFGSSSNKPSRYRTDVLASTTNQIDSLEILSANQQAIVSGALGSPSNIGERSPAPSNYHAIKQRSSSLNYQQNLNVNSAGCGTSTNYINLTNIWDFVAEKNKRSSIFHNFLYKKPNKDDDDVVLRPKSSLPFLDLWDYYTADNMASGSIYDNLDCNESLDTFSSPSPSCDNFLSSKSPILSDDPQDQAVTFLTDNSNNVRRLIDLNYESVDFSQPPVFKSMLDAVFTLEKESDLLPQNWEQILSKIRQNVDRQGNSNPENCRNNPSFLTWSRWLNRTQHKRSTLELLLKGRTAGRQQQNHQRISHNLDQDNGQSAKNRHILQKFSFSMPENCSVCNRVLWDILKQGEKITNDVIFSH
uniref:Myotubularin phosphatase domain-containing protein n=1 Tax=Romanomermis culicivorax TaxID=13658 RepID=A0A915J032_ROMCU